MSRLLGIDPYTLRNTLKELEKSGVVEPYIVSRDGRGRTKYKIYRIKDEAEFKAALNRLRGSKGAFI